MGRDFPEEKIRNIGIMAHIDAGKTTTTERMLYYTGKIYKIGEVDEGTATMDYMVQEQERGITITSAATSCKWKDCIINIIDTPGHVDFTAEVERALRVLDGAIAVFCGVAGVQPQSETVWHQALKYNIPCISYINKLDRVGADFFNAVETIKEKLGANPLIMQVPYYEGEEFKGIIDLVTEKLLLFSGDDGAEIAESNIPDNYVEKVKNYKEELLEKLADCDDEIAEFYLEGREIDNDIIKAAIRSATIDRKLVPVFAGSSLKNKGVQPLLDAIIDYLPSPVDIGTVKGVDPKTEEKIEFELGEKEVFSAYIFKVVTDPFIGKLIYARIYSGKLKSGTVIYDSNSQKKERISKILRMHANRREEIKEAYAGDIVGLVGLKFAKTGHTLCTERKKVVYEAINFPEPVISIAVEAKNQKDYKKLEEALKKIEEEDPTFRKYIDNETGQLLLSGMGELHLDIIIDRLIREFKIEVNVGKPQVSFKETITNLAIGFSEIDKDFNGKRLFAGIKIEVFPLNRNLGFKFEFNCKRDEFIVKFLDKIEEGCRDALFAGELASFPVIDVGVRVIDIFYDEEVSNDIAFKMVATQAVSNALREANTVLLEPVMKVEIVSPEEYIGDIINDLNSRGGKIESLEKNKKVSIIKAIAPLSELFGYATELRSKSQGRATYTMQFAEYRDVPEQKAKKIIAKFRGEMSYEY